MFDFMKKENQKYNPLLDPNLSPEEKKKYVYVKPPSLSQEQLDTIHEATEILATYKGPRNPMVSTVTVNDDGTETESRPIPLTDEVKSRLNNGESAAQIANSINNDPYNGFFIAQENERQRQQQAYNPFAYQPSPILNTGMYYNGYGYNPYGYNYGYNPYYSNSMYSYNGLPRMVYSQEDIMEIRKEQEEAERERKEYEAFQSQFRAKLLYGARNYLGLNPNEEDCYRIANNISPEYVDDPEKVEIRHTFKVNIMQGDEVIASFGGEDEKLVGDQINRRNQEEYLRNVRLANARPVTSYINQTEWNKQKAMSPQDATLEEWDTKYYPALCRQLLEEQAREYQAKALLKASGKYTEYEKFVRKFTRKFRPNDYMYGYTGIGMNAGYQPPLTLSDVDVNPNIVDRYRTEADLRRAKFFAQIMNDGNSPYHNTNYYRRN